MPILLLKGVSFFYKISLIFIILEDRETFLWGTVENFV